MASSAQVPIAGGYRDKLVQVGLKRMRKVKRVECPKCRLAVADLSRHLAIVHEEMEGA